MSPASAEVPRLPYRPTVAGSGLGTPKASAVRKGRIAD